MWVPSHIKLKHDLVFFHLWLFFVVLFLWLLHTFLVLQVFLLFVFFVWNLFHLGQHFLCDLFLLPFSLLFVEDEWQSLLDRVWVMNHCQSPFVLVLAIYYYADDCAGQGEATTQYQVDYQLRVDASVVRVLVWVVHWHTLVRTSTKELDCKVKQVLLVKLAIKFTTRKLLVLPYCVWTLNIVNAHLEVGLIVLCDTANKVNLEGFCFLLAHKQLILESADLSSPIWLEILKLVILRNYEALIFIHFLDYLPAIYFGRSAVIA